MRHFRERAAVIERRTIYHESGHATIAAQYGWPIRRVAIHQRRTPEGEAGLCELVNFADALEADAFRSIVYLMAGPSAERQFTGRSDTGDLRDREQAAAIAQGIHEHRPADHPDIARTLQHAELIARALMLDDATWAAVKAVAKALEHKQRLSGSEVRFLVRQACQVRA
jgi:hypothetical protein